MGPSFGVFETDKCVTHNTKASYTPRWKTTRTPPRSPPPAAAAAAPSVPSSSRKWPRFWSGSKPTGRKLRGRRRRKRWHGSISTDSFAAHYPQFFTRERTGMFPLYRLLAPQVREREREKIPLAAETSSVVFCARFSPRAVFCADGDILLSFSIWYVRNSWTKNARRTI